MHVSQQPSEFEEEINSIVQDYLDYLNTIIQKTNEEIVQLSKEIARLQKR
jgi:prefoldin subunit 5